MHYQIPKWLENIDHRILTKSEKALLKFLWWCGDVPCDSWNYRLAQITGFSKRTITRNLSKLYKLRLIKSEGSYGKNRQLTAVKYPTISHFFAGSAQGLASHSARKCLPSYKGLKINKQILCQKLYDEQENESINEIDPVNSGGRPPNPQSGGSVENQLERLIYQGVLSKLKAAGHSSERAARLARKRTLELLKKRKAKDG